MIRDKMSGITIDTEGIVRGRRLIRGKIRDAVSIRIRGKKHYELDGLFVDGADYEEVIIDADGNTITGADYSDFMIAGDIIDHRDGSFTVILGMPTEEEKAVTEAEEKAIALTVGMDEEEAEAARELLMEWKPGRRYPEGAWIKRDGEVCRCVRAHVSRKTDTPGMSAAYSRLSREAKEGERS